jgi:hypothetical protein
MSNWSADLRRALGAAEMGLITGTREIARVVSDGTGVSPEEIGLLVAEAAVAGTLFGVLRAVDVVMDMWPTPPGRAEK